MIVVILQLRLVAGRCDHEVGRSQGVVLDPDPAIQLGVGIGSARLHIGFSFHGPEGMPGEKVGDTVGCPHVGRKRTGIGVMSVHEIWPAEPFDVRVERRSQRIVLAPHLFLRHVVTRCAS